MALYYSNGQWVYQKEKDQLLKTIVPFDKHETEHDAPGFKK